VLRLRGLADQALINQRNASADLSGVKADDIAKGGTGSGGSKKNSPSTVSNTVVRAKTAGNDAIQTVFDNIWAKSGGANPPAGWNEEEDGVWGQSDEYKAKVKWSNEQRRKSFGTIMLRTITAMSAHLKALGYTPFQIKKMAYQTVSARVQPPSWWTTANKDFLSKLAGKG